MKIHSFISHLLVFLTILICCIIPPFFVANNGAGDTFSTWQFPLSQLIFFIIAILIYIFFFDFSNQKTTFPKFLIFQIFPGILTLGILFTVSLILKAVSVYFSRSFFNGTQVSLPENFTGWLFCILNFIFAAFYEEVIYRFFFPESLLYFCSKISSKKIFRIICEIISLLVFAFSHLYLGWLSVINAAIGYVVLRVCFKKTKNIFAGFSAHFVYNFICLLLLS